MLKKKESVIIKFDFSAEQTVGDITKIVGLTMAKYLVPIIDVLDLEANPRSSKTGPVTAAIQESIETDPTVFPFKTKGILLAASQYERLERNRVKITPENPAIEGILDGGHNTLAIGLYILAKRHGICRHNLSKRPKDLERIQGALECKPPSCGVVSEGQRYRCAEFCPAAFYPGRAVGAAQPG